MRIANGAHPTRADDGLHAMKYVYSALVHHLNVARKQAPGEFFNSIGCPFVDWSPYNLCKVRESDVTLSWMGDMDAAASSLQRISLRQSCSPTTIRTRAATRNLFVPGRNSC